MRRASSGPRGFCGILWTWKVHGRIAILSHPETRNRKQETAKSKNHRGVGVSQYRLSSGWPCCGITNHRFTVSQSHSFTVSQYRNMVPAPSHSKRIPPPAYCCTHYKHIRWLCSSAALQLCSPSSGNWCKKRCTDIISGLTSAPQPPTSKWLYAIV